MAKYYQSSAELLDKTGMLACVQCRLESCSTVGNEIMIMHHTTGPASLGCHGVSQQCRTDGVFDKTQKPACVRCRLESYSTAAFEIMSVQHTAVPAPGLRVSHQAKV